MEELGSSPTKTRIYNCRKWNPHGESQKDIASDLGVGVGSMNKHVNSHQNPDQTEVIAKKYNNELQQRKVDANNIRFEIAEQGLKDLKEGKMKITSNVLAGVARDQDNKELKEQQNKMKVFEMLANYMSGENNGNPPILGNGDNTGEAR